MTDIEHACVFALREPVDVVGSPPKRGDPSPKRNLELAMAVVW